MQDTFTRFATRFNRLEPRNLASPLDLDEMERVLQTLLPQSYREFMLTHGELYAPGLLNLIVSHELDLYDLQNIMPPRQAIEDTHAYWEAGMPRYVIGFASDCMGNLFGFRRLRAARKRPNDCAVLVFDHDFVEVHRVAPSFESFLAAFLAIPDGAA